MKLFNSAIVVVASPYGVKPRDMWTTFVYTAECLGFTVSPIYKPAQGFNFKIDANNSEFIELIKLTKEAFITEYL